MIKKIPLFFLFFVLLGFIVPNSSFAQYTLTDNDVVVVSGVIESCSYNFALTDIIIPDMLDGQTVVGIEFYHINGVFSNKGITSIVFPNTIINIPGFSFSHNSISNLDLSNNTNLQSIGHYAFLNNQLISINIPNSVTSIGYAAFNQNNIVTINNSPSEGFIFARNDSGNDDTTHIVSYGGNNTDVIISSGVTTIGNDSFRQSNIMSVDFSLCNTLTTIQTAAFAHNNLTSVDLHDFTSLISIDNSAFRFNFIDSLNLNGCNNLIIIDEAAFYDNNLTSFVLTGCDSLASIGLSAFYWNQITNVNLNDCDKLSSIDGWAFELNYISSVNIDSCDNLVYLGEDLFKDNPITSFILPTPIIPDSILVGWEDSNGGMHAGGETVTDLITYYDAVFTEIIDYTVTFTVTDGTNPIENANVNFGGYGEQITDASGLAVFADVIPEDNINYTITASEYHDYTDSLSVVDMDINENIELTLIRYNVTFVVEDNDGFLENATVNLTGYGSQISDANGVAIFNNVAPENDIVYTVIAAEYFDVTDALTVFDTDITDSVFMSLATYSVTFNVGDGTNPIPGATVDFAGYGTEVTDNYGVAIFDSIAPNTDINYSVFCSGYISYYDSVTVIDANITESVILTYATTYYSVTFIVTDGNNPISGASVDLSGHDPQLTNNQGITVFKDVSSGNDVPYNVAANGYDILYGFVTIVDEDIEENVTLTLSSYEVTFEISDGNSNIADATITLEGYGSQISNNDGIVVFEEVLSELLNYTVSAASFIDVSGVVEVENDNVYEYVLMNPTGVTDYNNKQITISPNPATNYINIANCINNEISIFNAEGLLLNCIVPDSDSYKVDISNISSGLIFIQIDNNVIKIIKK